MRITRLIDLTWSDALSAELDSIFFEASSIQTFASSDARAAFRQRWLGSYLDFDKNEVFLAVDNHGKLAGYVVGALVDPAHDPRHDQLGYFRDFAPLTRDYPAHLHINVAPQHRSAGLGARMIEAFAAHARAQGAPGLHIVTGAGMRNVGFYLRNGFVALAEAPWKGGSVVMLGRKLA